MPLVLTQMPFHFINTPLNENINLKKGEAVMYKQSNRNRKISNPRSERASVSGPKANVTIEAAFAIPFFLFAFL